MKLIGALLAVSCITLANAHGPLGKDFLLEQDLSGSHCAGGLCGDKLLLTEYVPVSNARQASRA